MSKLAIILGIINVAEQAWKTAIDIRNAAKQNRELTAEEEKQLDERISQGLGNEAWKRREST